MSTSEQSASISAKISPEMKRKIRIEAARQDMTMSQYVREVLAESLQEDEGGRQDGG